MQSSLVNVAADSNRIELLKIRFSGIIAKAEETLRPSTMLEAGRSRTPRAQSRAKRSCLHTTSSGPKTDEGTKKKKANVRAVEAQRHDGRERTKLGGRCGCKRRGMGETTRKMRLQKERDAARAAVLSMKRTVLIYENLEIMEEIEALRKRASPRILGQLGCFLKSEYAAGDDDDDDEVLDILEEGEILE